MANPRWTHRPEGSTWGDWGADDQKGRMNLLTAEKVRQGIAEVTEGRTFCLSLPLDLPGGSVLNPRRHPPVLGPTMRDGMPGFTFPMSRVDPRYMDVSCDDTVLMALQYSTQWDSLCHIGQQFDVDGDGRREMVFYNGYRAVDDVVGPIDYRDGGQIPTNQQQGARKLGIENMAETCVQGRGVMIDLMAHFGVQHKFVGYDDLMSVMDRDGIVVEEGDMVCLRTGLDRILIEKQGDLDDSIRETVCGLDGRDAKLLQWITDSGLAALLSDNIAVECSPSKPCTEDPCVNLPLHAHCLFKLGVHLGEMFLLSDLADWLRENGRNRFLLTAPPLRLPGAVGSPSTAVATV